MKKKLFDLSDQNILLTGATGHLGYSMLEALLDFGAHVFVNSRSKAKYDDIIKNLDRRFKNKITPAIFDLNNYKKVKFFFKNDIEIHTIINNAFNCKTSDFEKFNKNDYDNTFKLGLTSVAHLNSCALKSLKKGSANIGTASIINIASMYGVVSPNPKNYNSKKENNPPHYGSMKAALIQYTKYAAVNLAKYGIRVNSISPGAFPKLSIRKNKKFISKLKKNIPLNRVGLPSDIKTSIIYLSSKNSSYVTGTNLIIDGGWTAW